CPAPHAQPPCGAGTVHGPAAEPAPDAGIANPIHLFTGEKFLREIDLPEALPGGHPSFVRLYRSGAGAAGPLGPGWTSEYAIGLHARPDGWRLTLPDGRQVRFDRQGRGAAPGDGRIAMPAPAASRTSWHGVQGHRLDFDTHGRLREIAAPGRADLRIEYHDDGPLRGLMRSIRRGAAVLRLDYDLSGPTPRLRALETPLGVFRYAYTAMADSAAVPAPPALLSAVRRPDGMRRHYHYESGRQAGHPAALTGVTLETADGRRWRARSWTYDARGRVIQAIPGGPGTTTGR